MVCPDCNRPLVDRVNPRTVVATRPDDSWVVVGGVARGVSSDAARGTLDSNNIPSVILNQSLLNIGLNEALDVRFKTGDSGGEVILVPKEFREEAALVLEAVLGDELIQYDSQKQ
jgi:hypothetical protein